MFEISLVVAVAENGVIGKDNALPWRLPGDLKYFKSLTMGHPIIMGRLTYDSIGKPLPGRTNIVITRQQDWQAEGVIVSHSLEGALAEAEASEQGQKTSQAMLIGGANLYQQALPKCHRLYLTEVHAEVEGDAFFPEINRKDWREVSRKLCEAKEQNSPSYSFVELHRNV